MTHKRRWDLRWKAQRIGVFVERGAEMFSIYGELHIENEAVATSFAAAMKNGDQAVELTARGKVAYHYATARDPSELELRNHPEHNAAARRDYPRRT